MFLLKGDNQKVKQVAVKPLPSAKDIVDSCDPVDVYPVGTLKITGSTLWFLTHSKFCLGYKDVVSVVSIEGDVNVDKHVSLAIVKGYVKSLRDRKALMCSFDVKAVDPVTENNEGTESALHPYILSCQNFE